MWQWTRFVVGVCVAFLLFFSTGCATQHQSGPKMERATLDRQIEKGKTTQSEVEAKLGQPTSFTMMGDGRLMTFYIFSASHMQTKVESYIPIVNIFRGGTTGTNQQKMLQILYDKNSVVENYMFNDSTNKVEARSSPFGPRVSSTPVSQAQ